VPIEIVPRFINCALVIKLQKKVNTMIVIYNLRRIWKEWGMVCITAMSINIMVVWGMIPSLLVIAYFKVLFLQFTEETEEDKNHTSR
jgi:hypothetical protein